MPPPWRLFLGLPGIPSMQGARECLQDGRVGGEGGGGVVGTGELRVGGEREKRYSHLPRAITIYCWSGVYLYYLLLAT